MAKDRRSKLKLTKETVRELKEAGLLLAHAGIGLTDGQAVCIPAITCVNGGTCTSIPL